MELIAVTCCSCGGEVECEKWGGGECGKCGLHYEWSESYSPDANELAKRYPHPIPVSERLPEDGDEIMAFCTWQIPPYGEAGQWIAGEFHKEPARFVLDWVDSDGGDEFCWIVDSPSKRNITHWLPMPPKPE